jgi:hypothetical protein
MGVGARSGEADWLYCLTLFLHCLLINGLSSSDNDGLCKGGDVTCEAITDNTLRPH